MKKILIAMDSYKGTLSSLMLANIIKSHYPIKDASFTVLPISDGGEGFVDAIAYSIQHKQIDLYVEDAFGNVIPTKYIIDDHETAIMELALSSGLGMIEEKYRNPLKTSSYGLGQTMIDALNRGVKKMIIGLGGSSTNDGGAGMLKAIGVRFYDDHHHEIERLNGQTISMISSIDFHEIDARFKEVDIQVACDVRNPLLGSMGATQVYSRQKGAKECQVNQLERDMMHFAKVSLAPGQSKELTLKIDYHDLKIYQDGFKLEDGEYMISINASSRDVRYQEIISIDSEDSIVNDHLDLYKNLSSESIISDEDYKALLGYDIPPYPSSKPFTLNSTIGEIRKTFIDEKIYKIMYKKMAYMIESEDNDTTKKMIEKSIKEMPFRSLVVFSGGDLSIRRAQGMLDLMNKRFIRGLIKLILG